jgi:hypothetical protein
MQSSRKRCPVHGIPMAKSVLTAVKRNADGFDSARRWVDVQYYCHVCKAKEAINRRKAMIPRS